jgi:PAS domain-containing protein
VLQKDEGTLSSVMQELVELLPAGWQYPEITAARIILGEQEARTANFSPGYTNKQLAAAHLMVQKRLLKWFIRSKTNRIEDAFFAEERFLINMLADMFCVYLNRKEEAESLKKSEANLNTIFDSTDTIYVLMDSNFQIMSYNKPALNLLQKNWGMVYRSPIVLWNISRTTDRRFAWPIKKSIGGNLCEL